MGAPPVLATVSRLKFCPPKLCTRPPAGNGAPVAPPSTKSPSHAPEVPASRLPELPADEKYSAPSAVTSFTAWITAPPFVLEMTPAA